jgi:hypothetical protein
MLNSAQFPIGKYQSKDFYTESEISSFIEDISNFPSVLKKLLATSPPDLLNKTYRKDGWTGFQLIHHCADSHMNSFIRFKLALTEDNPIIKPYKEDLWALTSDSDYALIEDSLAILTGLHKRWEILLKNLTRDDLNKTFFHPEQEKSITLKEAISQYSWHCRHHMGHLKIILNPIYR